MESVLARIGADLTLQDDLLVRGISNLLLVIRGTGVSTIIIRRFLIIVAAELAEHLQLGWFVLGDQCALGAGSPLSSRPPHCAARLEGG